MVTSIELSQNDADRLISLEKHYLEKDPVNYPLQGEKISLELKSTDQREIFLLDINRGRVSITYQNRYRPSIILLRLDFIGSKHRNPDGELISCPHLHIYREDYADKWAFEITSEDYKEFFSDPTDKDATMDEFLDFCNIKTKPVFQMAMI